MPKLPIFYDDRPPLQVASTDCRRKRRSARRQTLMERSQGEYKFLTLNEAADFLRVSRRTIARVVKHNRLPALKVGGQWRILEDQFMEWVRQEQNRLSKR